MALPAATSTSASRSPGETCSGVSQHNRILRPGLAQIVPIEVLDASELRWGFDQVDQVADRWIEKKKIPRVKLDSWRYESWHSSALALL